MRTVTEALYIYPNGREVCRKDTWEGRAMYRCRTLTMLKRQGGRCCLEFYAPMCPGALRKDECTFEHENGRGAGKQDDRIVLPDGKLINGAAHVQCNQWKSSRRIDYNRHAPSSISIGILSTCIQSYESRRRLAISAPRNGGMTGTAKGGGRQ